MGNLISKKQGQVETKNEDANGNYHLENRIIIRVWKLSGKNVGHVSIEFPIEHNNGRGADYVSFWPEDPESKSYFAPTKPHLMSNVAEDIAAEGTEPHYVACLYSLSLPAMKSELRHFKRILDTRPTTSGWYLVPCCSFGGEGENCATLAWRLLVAGGVKEGLISDSEITRVSSKQTGKASSKVSNEISKSNVEESKVESIRAVEHAISKLVQSPDALIPWLDKARKKEVAKYPEIRALKFESESPLLLPPKQEKFMKCINCFTKK